MAKVDETNPTPKPKRVLSAEGRQRIIEAQKARWAAKPATKTPAKKKAKKAAKKQVKAAPMPPEEFANMVGSAFESATNTEESPESATRRLATELVVANERIDTLDKSFSDAEDQIDDLAAVLLRERQYHQLRVEELGRVLDGLGIEAL
jgi:hypothetical protein